MKTRFDNSAMWVTGDDRHLNIRDMETNHLLNTVRMFVKKPYSIASMLIKDIENCAQDYYPEAWTPTHIGSRSVVKESINAVTSMSKDELVAYALNSPLCSTMMSELLDRGVNIHNLMDMWTTEASEQCQA